ncbi:hypothetical protein [Natrinema saccharevitans]|uniref:hypothetical protein n=1 Tax=Natrinema saccharevitans TaxID=301967 RepID=UPI00158C402F|nr:hypothetical protein [Natrinema saccharevitans]
MTTEERIRENRIGNGHERKSVLADVACDRSVGGTCRRRSAKTFVRWRALLEDD